MLSRDYEKLARDERDAWARGSGDVESQQPDQPQRRHRAAMKGRTGSRASKIALASTLAALVFVAFMTWPFPRHPHRPALSLEELRNGTYRQQARQIQWLENGQNGQFVAGTQDGFEIAHWESQNDKKLIAPLHFDANGTNYIQKFTLNPQQTHAIVATEVKKNWRHSTFARYWILDVETQRFSALHDKPLSIAQWSPNGKSVAYVLDHNVYVHNVAKRTTQQVTFDGGEDVFTGIPDWVYEEEVFGGDSALWWSPNSKFVAYVRTNDSLVPKFPIPYFMGSKAASSSELEAYPELVELKYPKPGYPNPKVEFWVYNVESGAAELNKLPTTLNEPIISEVIWVGAQAVVKIMSRESDFLEVWIVDPAQGKIERSRAYSSEELGGSWFEVTHNSHAVEGEGYIDTVDVDGYNHLGLFAPANAAEPKLLTQGEWEVQDKSIAVNLETRHVYFHATKRNSTESTVYRVSLDKPGQEPELVAFEGEGVYSAAFSADATFATVNYVSPTAPLVQKVVKLGAASKDKDEGSHEWRLEDNQKLHDLLDSRKLLDDTVFYGTVDVGNGVEVNYREIRPTSFNAHKKHPLLFFNYGGPGSQQVQKQLSIDFQRVYAETHNAVVVTVDPRGTGFKGRKFRSVVRDHLGEFEADDVISVAKIWNEKKYIDSDTTAIWGWSYGGFLTLKTLERDTDLAFKYGVAVAPVTNWALYDSIYTERYMHTPEHNPEGYAASAVANVTNIGAHNRFLIMHGTGDDNVHFQNTLSLLDKFDLAGVENYDVHVFPDSDHGISFHNANTIVYDKIDQWLTNQQK